MLEESQQLSVPILWYFTSPESPWIWSDEEATCTPESDNEFRLMRGAPAEEDDDDEEEEDEQTSKSS